MKRYLSLSVVFHVLVVAYLLFTGAKESDPNSKIIDNVSKNNIQVRTLTEKDFQKELKSALKQEFPKEAQIVQSDDQLQTEKAPDKDKESFLSKHNNIVDHNTRAEQVGKFKNNLKEATAEPAPSKKLFDLAPNPKDLEQREALNSKTGMVRVSPPNRKPSQDKQDPNAQGASATDDYLKDIAIGTSTLLNTREFTFYSFFERIRERLANEWHAELDREMEHYLRMGKNIQGDRKTKVEVRLDESGHVKEIRILGSSGLEVLDRAATNAFKQAGPFPNPPNGMLEKDKSVLIRWDFIVMSNETEGLKIDIRREPAGF